MNRKKGLELLRKERFKLIESKGFRSPNKIKKSFSSKFLLVSLKDFFYLFTFLFYQKFRMWFKYGLGASALSGRVELTCET